MLKNNPANTPYKGGKIKVDHVSASSASSYLQCGFKWKLSRIDGLRKKKIALNFVFGSAMHKAAEPLWKGKSMNFALAWAKAKNNKNIDYGRYSWLGMLTTGQAMSQSLSDEMRGTIHTSETKTEVSKTIDLGSVKLASRKDVVTVAKDLPMLIDGRMVRLKDEPVVLDLKTSGRKYAISAIDQSQQLMTYAISEDGEGRDDVYSAYVVVTKSLRPTIQVIGKKYTDDEIKGQIRRLKQVARLVRNGVFIQVKGNHCAWCDYKPLCYSEPGWETMYDHSGYRPGDIASNNLPNSDK